MKKILETTRLFLREMTMDDYDALYAVLADAEITEYLRFIHTASTPTSVHTRRRSL